jgi:hypothetical protein
MTFMFQDEEVNYAPCATPKAERRAGGAARTPDGKADRDSAMKMTAA